MPAQAPRATDAQELSLANWHQLTPAQKTELNPHDCPPDDGGFVHIRADNGHCQPPKTMPTTEPEQQMDELEAPSGYQGALGQPFAYSQDLEVTVNGLICKQAAGAIRPAARSAALF